MRAVKAIIMAAGALKRNFPDEDEAYLTLRAISDCNIPKFTSEDVPLFNAILSDLYPETKQQNSDYGELDAAINLVVQERHFFINEVKNFNFLICLRINFFSYSFFFLF